MSLIDHAARALAGEWHPQDWDSLGSEGQDRYRRAVRTMIDALRDPDERMTEAGAEIVRNVSRAESREAYRSDAANTWRFMIDALASEGK